jgi:hypothetical protein
VDKDDMSPALPAMNTSVEDAAGAAGGGESLSEIMM